MRLKLCTVSRLHSPTAARAAAARAGALLACAAVVCYADTAQAQDAGLRSAALQTSGMLGFESVRLPQGERLGLVGGSLLFDIGGDWGVGPAIYGAATGRRGGFFVGGVELQRRWALAPGLSIATGLYAGGGGGGGAPVGGGLMLRPAVTLLKDLGESLQAGVSLSSVRFPSGLISSTQLGLTLAWRSEFVHFAPASGSTVRTASLAASALPTQRAAGLGFERIALLGGNYRLDAVDNTAARPLHTAGARAERRSNVDGFVWGLEAAGAVQGGAAGYMELTGTTAFTIAPLAEVAPSWRLGVRFHAGLAGGGGIDTGGGLIGKAAATTEMRVGPGLTLGAEYGLVRTRGALRARQAQLWLALDLEPDLDARGDSGAHLVRSEWVGALQHHTGERRTDGTRRVLDTIGLKLNRYLGDHFYLTGQAYSAFAGGAGAYSAGLVGAGLATAPDRPWRAGAELVVGAAGGGGVQTGGGAVAQGLLWAGWTPTTHNEWRLGIGRSRSFRGGTGSPLVEAAWSHDFGMAGR
jgi:hypothetical protein